MNEATHNNGKIVFELGTINGDATVTSVEIKDVLIMKNARVLE